jgi:hypothetical protein
MGTPSLEALLGDPQVGPGNQLQAEAMRKILNAALFAGAVGVGARTLRGAGNFLGRNFGAGPHVPAQQSMVPIPVPVQLGPQRRRSKYAAATADPLKEPLTWASQHLSRGLMKVPGRPSSAVGDLFSGWDASAPVDKPWAWPVGALAIGGGLYGGYKLTDWLLDKARRREVDSELETARKNYQQAMMGQYEQKSAAVDPVDALYDLPDGEKRALVGSLLGAALLGMGALAGGSGIAAYNWGRGHSRTKTLEEAIRRRQEALFAQAPRPIIALPIPHEVGTAPVVPGDDEDDEDEKSASLTAAADQALRRLRNQKAQAARQWQIMINGPPKEERVSREQPQQPQLPTLAGTYTRFSTVPGNV